MDTKNHILTFAELGMADPFKPETSLPLAEQTIKDMNFFTNLYEKYKA
jgi:hypothetical protein